MVTLAQKAALAEEAPAIFLPISGGWGKMGHTHLRLAVANEDVLTGALRTARKLRLDKKPMIGFRPKKRCFTLSNSRELPQEPATPTFILA